MFKRILVGVDGSTSAQKAAALAADLAKLYDADLSIAYVVGGGQVSPELMHLVEVEHLSGPRAEAPADEPGFPPDVDVLVNQAESQDAARRAWDLLGQRTLERMGHLAVQHGAPRIETHLLQGDPAEEVLKQARSCNADLVVIGSRGLGQLKGLLLGSVSAKISQLAACTCITVR